MGRLREVELGAFERGDADERLGSLPKWWLAELPDRRLASNVGRPADGLACAAGAKELLRPLPDVLPIVLPGVLPIFEGGLNACLPLGEAL